MEGLTDEEVAEITGAPFRNRSGSSASGKAVRAERMDEDGEAAPPRKDQRGQVASSGQRAVQSSPVQGDVCRAFELPG